MDLRFKYRRRIDLIASILGSAARKEEALLTRIMYTSFLSYPQTKQLLQFMLEHGLIKHDGLNKVYNITLKGFQYLELYKQIGDLVKIE